MTQPTFQLKTGDIISYGTLVANNKTSKQVQVFMMVMEDTELELLETNNECLFRALQCDQIPVLTLDSSLTKTGVTWIGYNDTVYRVGKEIFAEMFQTYYKTWVRKPLNLNF